ncbi:lipid kinase, YegS/Rv2252/BmrU family [Clostridium cavendishii DSM 21758]|uniref:Lipid kinase, YegS/Rv2252/BmrU family n=1 Tax=Clostridium cavendishii DSM 21758 TaxID=1121302 RepID=A0A1M6MVX2_9CLOT|nr:YegS/Rv2252/BmrU family lipid kinase [Clostridium cavendishii]SHJ87539.1 lipid kinase, YegS/Rv2252/BmrU family [Clostridium cavendishii DSM 21758]
MNKVKFIYNPFSGENAILSELDNVIKLHQASGYTIVPFRIDKDLDVAEALKDIDESYSYILVAGGDGTVDNIVNAMKKMNIDLPLAILPVGTANDFAKFIGMPANVSEACIKILESKPVEVDLGKVNDKYFINVLSTGLFTDVSQKTDVNLKNTIGKLAYYLKGLEQLPNFRRLKVKITSEGKVYDEYMYLMLVFNGQTAGNLKLATRADVSDGQLDVVVFRAVSIKDLIPLFIKVLKGEHLDDEKVLYLKTDDLLIECDEDIVTDIDGEKGPDFPLSVKCIKGGIKLLGIK